MTTTRIIAGPAGAGGVAGSVDVDNFPAVQPVSDNAGSLTVDDGGGSLTVDGTLAGAVLEVPFSTSSVGALSGTDAAGYRYVSVQVTSAGTGGVIFFEVSNDNTNWVTTTLSIPQVGGNWLATAIAPGIMVGPVLARYFRLRVGSLSSGTVAGVIEFFTHAAAFKIETGLPATAALADGAANPSTSITGAARLTYNGTTWDRARTADAAAGASGTGLPGAGLLGHDGTNWQRAGVLVGDTGQNQQLVAGGRKEVSFTTTTVQAVASTDVSNYRWVSVQVTSQGGSSTVTFQASNDSTNWVSIGLMSSTSTAGPVVQNTATTGIWHGPLGYRYFRLNVTGIASGTTAGVIEFFALAGAFQGIGVDTELPSAAASADGASNPTAPFVQAAGQIYNGTTWDRTRGATSAAGTTGTGVPAAGIMGFDGTNYQRIKTDTNGYASVDPRAKAVRLAVTPTVSTSPAYTAKDAIGGLMTFANAARASGGSIYVDCVQINDKNQQMKEMDLLLFDRSITAPTDNAAFNPSDAELSNCIGYVNIAVADYKDLSNNTVAHKAAGFTAVLNGTDLFGVLVARGASSFAAITDLTVTITIVQD